jgi:hypothetical protein
MVSRSVIAASYSRASMALALEIDIGIAADVDRDPLDRAAGERVRVLARVVAGDRLAAVPADAQALTRDHEHPGLGLDAALADLLVPVVQGQDPGGHVRRVLPVLVERRGQDQVLPGRDVLRSVDLLLRHADEVVDVMQPVVLDIQGVPAEPRTVREQHALRAGSGDVH